MWLMMRAGGPDDYVIATGEAHSVGESLEEAFGHLGLDREEYAEVYPRYFRPAEVDLLVGDSGKARAVLGRGPEVGFREPVKIMADSDMRLARQEAVMKEAAGEMVAASARWGMN